MLHELIKFTSEPSDWIEIERLVKDEGCNPFRTNEYGNSAFSTSLRDGNWQLAEWFIQTTKSELYNTLKERCHDGESFCYLICSEILDKNSPLASGLNFDKKDCLTCFSEAIQCYEYLGGDSCNLYDFYLEF